MASFVVSVSRIAEKLAGRLRGDVNIGRSNFGRPFSPTLKPSDSWNSTSSNFTLNFPDHSDQLTSKQKRETALGSGITRTFASSHS